MKVKYIGLTAVVLITVAIISYKTELSAKEQVASHSATPRILLVAKLSEADVPADSCAQIIHLVRAAHDRGIAVQEIDSGDKSPLLARYHVLVIPTVLIFDRSGKEVRRLEGEGWEVVKKLRAALKQLK